MPKITQTTKMPHTNQLIEEWKGELVTLLNRKGLDHLPTENIYEDIMDFISQLLAEQKKELITKIPDDLKTFVRMSIDNNWQFTEEQVIKAEVAWNKLMERKLAETEQECDKKWRTAIETHKAIQLERFETIPDKNNLIDKDVARGFLIQALETLLNNK